MKIPFEVKVWEGFWNREDVLNNKEYLFVYGDNLDRVGNGGQAIIRGIDNTIGLATKLSPSHNDYAYMTDEEYYLNVYEIDNDLNKIMFELLATNIFYSNKYKGVFLSSGGYGTGLAKLPEKAPYTYNYLCERLYKLFKYDNSTGKLMI